MVSVGHAYLDIALRLRRLVPDWVDSYAGPPELAAAVEAQATDSVRELGARVDEVAARVTREVAQPDRRRWLLAQLSGIATALRWLDGERPAYTDLFERCHGATVERVADAQFEQAHALLDRALPGVGDVAARYRAWRETQLVPRDHLQAGIDVLAGEMRRRSDEHFDLPADEEVMWELVTDEPWAGYADYLGRRRSRIRINVDLPIGGFRLLELVCHEAYPGHHSEHACKEANLVGREGCEELLVFVYPTPQPVMAEGLACCAVGALLGDQADRVAATCLAQAGVSYDHETAAGIREAQELLLPVRSNIVLMLDDGASARQARDYAREWLLEDAELIDKIIDALDGRSWRPYESCYSVGLALCRQYMSSGRGSFHHLLHGQLTPADLQ